jgi:glucose-6-phosphate-specific signal transduction histidine kinase
VSRKRLQLPPWLADHVIYAGYRWFVWLLSLGFVFWHNNQAWAIYGALLVVMLMVNLLTTMFAQNYLRLARRNPAVLSLDLLYAVPLLVSADGWNWAFFGYALSSLVAPALLYGWRGGLMAGLTFSGLQLAIGSVSGLTATQMIGDGDWPGGAKLLLILAVPACFGTFFPSLTEWLRTVVAEHQDEFPEKRLPFDDRPVRRDLAPPLIEPRVPPRSRDLNLPPAASAPETPFMLRAAAVGAPENGLEEIRRILFAPFSETDAELPVVLEILAERFKQHNSCTTRVSILGRTRSVPLAQRAVMVRLTQEALLNVQHHAQAGQVDLTLRYDLASVVLLIQDNGVGLLDGTYERPGLHALRAMSYRLSELGGRLDVFEAQNGGVTVRATVPLD